MRYYFGDFEFDSLHLRRGNAAVGLTPKAAMLLDALLDAAPNAVSKEALYDRLWRGVVVEDGNLHNLIRELRLALGDNAMIATVHRKGYAFAAPVTREATRGSRLELGNESIALLEGANIIGRELIGTPDVSREHARIDVHGSRVSIEDLDSKNGTFVNGERIAKRVALKEGDEIVFGRTRAVVRVIDAAAPTITVTGTRRQAR